mgnify:CR=1 FL=1
MAAAVEIASYNNATSNGASVSITKPTGLAVGELLVSMVVNNTSGTGGTSVDLKAGWTNIQNRTTYLKGKMNVDSSAQNGTSITIEIPLLV